MFTSTQDPGVPLNIRNEVVNQLAERLASRKRINKTDAVRIAWRTNCVASTKHCPSGIAFVRFRSGY